MNNSESGSSSKFNPEAGNLNFQEIQAEIAKAEAELKNFPGSKFWVMRLLELKNRLEDLQKTEN